jgi:hypothetical protein
MAGSEGSARHGPERVCHVIGPCADRWGPDFSFRLLFAHSISARSKIIVLAQANIDVIPIFAVKRMPRDGTRFRAARSFGAAAFLSTLALPAGFSQAACNWNLTRVRVNLEDWRRLLRNQAKLRT